MQIHQWSQVEMNQPEPIASSNIPLSEDTQNMSLSISNARRISTQDASNRLAELQQ